MKIKINKIKQTVIVSYNGLTITTDITNLEDTINYMLNRG